MKKNLTKVKEFRFKLYPKDFPKLKDFYQNILGFPIITEWEESEQDRGVMFNTGTTIIELLPTENFHPVSGCGLSLEVADVWQLWENFKNYQHVEFPLRDNSWGDTSFSIKDPEGLEITFFSMNR